MFIKLLSCILVSLLMVSCINTEDNIRPSEKVIVVRGLISPKDSLIKIALRQSIPFFNIGGNPYDEEYIKDAEVILSDGSRSIKLNYSEPAGMGPDYGFYIADSSLFPIYEDQTYYLNVNCPDGRSVNASCKIPVAASNISRQYDSSYTSSDYYWSRGFFYSVSWTNPNTQNVFYRILTLEEESAYDVNDPYELKNKNEYRVERYGGVNVTNSQISNHIIKLTNIYSVKKINTITIFSINKDEYSRLFQQSHMYSSDTSFSPDKLDGPLLNHDNTQNTNIEGGLGFFVGYNYNTINVIPVTEDETRDFPDSFSW